ncbi:hydrolase [Virgibacillus kekensis]|uniref:Hydrolase n=1 Tax=Virgibacillus kekensis TaxID=202261 RepID=A0ABV9DID0_9BACI
MDRKKFYVNIGSQEISQIKYGNNDEFIVYATEEEARILREKMDKMYVADGRAYVRSHVPIMEYHNDKANDEYDAGLAEAFEMIHDLGDDQTREFIEGLGILDDKNK